MSIHVSEKRQSYSTIILTRCPTTAIPVANGWMKKKHCISGVFEFLPLSLPTCSSDAQIEFHNLCLLVITPASRSDIYNTGSIDRSTTERVLESFVAAFKNIKCNLPVFVPTGQFSNSLYEGHLCLFPQDLSNEQFMKFRFHMLQVRDVQPAHTHLSGLTSLFSEKLKLHQRLHGKFCIILIYIRSQS